MEGTARGSRPLGMVLRTVGVWRRCCSQRCWPPDDTGWKDGRNRSRFPSSSSIAFRQEEDSIYPDTQMLLMILIISVKGRKEPHIICSPVVALAFGSALFAVQAPVRPVGGSVV